jgi:hypothetical protein
MTLFQRPPFPRASQFAAALAASVIACSSPAASNGLVASPSSVGESSTQPRAPSDPSATTSAAHTAGSRGQAVDPVELVVKRDLWPLEPASAEKLLQELGHVRREVPFPRALSIVGGPTGPVERFEVSYSQDDDGHWTFNAASFFLRDPDLQALYQKLETRIIERLGKPAWTERQGDLPSSGWNLGRDMSLLLAASPNQGERLLMLSVSEPEGEAE